MNTGKCINPAQPSQNRKNEKCYIPGTLYKSTGNPGGKLRPADKNRTRLQELSVMNNSIFSATHYDLRSDIKLDYTISRIAQEMSPSKLEIAHHLCEFERTQKPKSDALTVIRIHHAGLSGNISNFIDYEEN